MLQKTTSILSGSVFDCQDRLKQDVVCWSELCQLHVSAMQKLSQMTTGIKRQPV